MNLGNKINMERVNTLHNDAKAYYNPQIENKDIKAKSMSAQKVVFPEPYENANTYYNRNQFSCKHHDDEPKHDNHQPIHNMPNFDIKSLLPMLLGGNSNNLLTPLISMLGGGKGQEGGVDLAKIFELFKPKPKSKPAAKEQKEEVSKFDDMIIIED